ncbi:hypothetical protein ACXYTJ_17030 [Gilvimarinus sp. F26214L]|uniref:hypothetical protein n=1 Tax=Gilvimarinus sp. DZF01 TaxID=3461371 RepID=UPI004046026A
MNNLRLTIVWIFAILVFHFSGFLGVFFWFGGLLIIPAIAMLLQYRYLTGGELSRIFLAALPWFLYAISGLVAIRSIELEGAQAANQSFYSASLYSAIVGIIVLGFWGAYKKYGNECQQ